MRELDPRLPAEPVWPNAELAEIDGDPDVGAGRDFIGNLEGDEFEQRNHSLAQVRGAYLDWYKRTRVETGRANLNTFNGLSRFLKLVLRAGDEKRVLQEMSCEDYESLVAYWQVKANKKTISRRTARDYLSAFKHMIMWAKDTDRFHYELPKGFDRAFILVRSSKPKPRTYTF